VTGQAASSKSGASITDVAVKILKNEVTTEMKLDFEREVKIVSGFNHVNILKLLGVVFVGIFELTISFSFIVHFIISFYG